LPKGRKVTEIILELSKLAGVGLVSGIFSSLIANSDFRHRKWWELRVIAYQGVIEALSDIVYYYDRHYTAAIEYTEMSEEFKKKLSDYWDEAFPRVRKASDKVTIRYWSGENCKGCERKVDYQFSNEGKLVDVRLQ
jgi:hypothetical protein